MDLQESMARAIVQKANDPELTMLWNTYLSIGAFLRARNIPSATWRELSKALNKHLPKILKSEDR